MKRLRILPIILVVSLVSILILGALPAILSACPIDIKPGSNPNSINLGSNGVVPVAVISTDTFNTSLDLVFGTTQFAGASVIKWAVEDVSGVSGDGIPDGIPDGILDVIFFFKTQDLDLNENSTYAWMKLTDIRGGTFEVGDFVNIVKGKK